MSKFGDIIRKHGFRNTGDALLGFQIDLDAYLEDSELFEWIEVKRTGDDDCMLSAKCKLKADIPLTQAAEEVCRIWECDLRYSKFAEHSLEKTPNGFFLHFVTMAPGLGVVGLIECFKGNGEPDTRTGALEQDIQDRRRLGQKGRRGPVDQDDEGGR